MGPVVEGTGPNYHHPQYGEVRHGQMTRPVRGGSIHMADLMDRAGVCLNLEAASFSPSIPSFSSDLRCKMIIGEDIIEPEGIVIDSQQRVAWIKSCKGLRFKLQITPKGRLVLHRRVRTAQKMSVPPGSLKMWCLKSHDMTCRPSLCSVSFPSRPDNTSINAPSRSINNVFDSRYLLQHVPIQVPNYHR
jgi:hypothetical protein